ncbi:MAG TPA: DNA-binding protein [Porphyromonadaceae bacterium]|nr:DNA-binding protein [Porphyromonadaceae bacterium]
MAKITVKDTDIVVYKKEQEDYISLTDIAKVRDNRSEVVIQNWMRTRMTIELLGLWETLYNPTFKHIEFDVFKSQAGLNAFVLSPTQWVEKTNAIGLVVKAGRYGGTFAHRDIAFEFASWISVEFKLYLVKEFQRLKEEDQKAIGWNAKRELSKINYHIHTDAIKHNLIPAELTSQQTSVIYATEADVLNMALFGITAKEWRESNTNLKGNMRDYATINELICLSNMENLNAVFINEGLSQRERLIKLNLIAIQQMRVLADVKDRKLLK